MNIKTIIKKIQTRRIGEGSALNPIRDKTNELSEEKTKEEARRFELRETSPNYLTDFHKRNTLHNITEIYRHVEIVQGRKNLIKESSLQISAEKQIENIKKNKNVREVRILPTAIKVFTHEINTTYLESNGTTQSKTNLGKFCLKWAVTDTTPNIKSETYPDRRHPHPCIKRNGSVCLGDFESVITENIKVGRLELCIDTMMHFLQSLDTGNPYVQMYEILRGTDEESDEEEEEEFDAEVA